MVRRRRYKYTSLCNDFIQQSIKTWNIIRFSEITGISYGEESLTDANLLELQIKHPFEIKTKSFTRHQESINGADWEWWLGSGDQWLGIRIQAKKINPSLLRYEHIEHSNKHGRQVDLLIHHSYNSHPRRIPLYVFYNFWNTDRYDPPWNCGTYAKNLELLGCGISHALAVRSVINQPSDNLHDISRIMYPWSCIIYCPGHITDDERLPFRSFDFIRGTYWGEINRSENLHKRDSFIVSEPPDYVIKIFKDIELSERDWAEIDVPRVTVIYEQPEY